MKKVLIALVCFTYMAMPAFSATLLGSILNPTDSYYTGIQEEQSDFDKRYNHNPFSYMNDEGDFEYTPFQLRNAYQTLILPWNQDEQEYGERICGLLGHTGFVKLQIQEELIECSRDMNKSCYFVNAKLAPQRKVKAKEEMPTGLELGAIKLLGLEDSFISDQQKVEKIICENTDLQALKDLSDL